MEGGKDSPVSVDTELKGQQFVLYDRPMAGRALLVIGRRSRDEPLLFLLIVGLRGLSAAGELAPLLIPGRGGDNLLFCDSGPDKVEASTLNRLKRLRVCGGLHLIRIHVGFAHKQLCMAA